MPYIDSSYANMPSVWQDMFEDKKVVDSLLESSISMIADSYSEILRGVINKSIYSDKQLKKTYCTPIILRIEDSVNLVDSDGNIEQAIVPVDTQCISFSYIGNSSTLDASTSVLPASNVRLVTSPTEVSAIQSRHNSNGYLTGYSKFLVFRNSSFEAAQLTVLSSSVEQQARVINLPKQAKYDETLLSLEAGSLQTTIITIKEFGKSITRSIEIRRDYINLSATTPSIVLPPKNRILNSAHVEITIEGVIYQGEVTTIQTNVVDRVIYAINSQEDALDMYSKFGFHTLGSTLTTTDYSSNLALSTSRVAIEGFTTKNVLRLLNALSGSPLFIYGKENSEAVLNFSTKLNRVVSTLAVYQVPPRLSVSLAVIDSCRKINTKLAENFVVVKDNSIRATSISVLERIKSSSDVLEVGIILGGARVDLDLVYIGRDYILLEKRAELNIAETIVEELYVNTSRGEFTVTSDAICRNLLASGSILSQKDPLTSYFTIINGLSAVEAAEIGSVYIPSKLYKTFSTRRLVSSKDYKLEVGAMPLHLVGDYGIFVSDSPEAYVKASAYYLYRDFYFRNSTYLHITYKDYAEAIGVAQVSSVLNALRPVWAVMLYGSSFALTDYVVHTNLITDSLSKKITFGISDSKQMAVSEIKKIEESLNVRYFTVKLQTQLQIDVGTVTTVVCSGGSVTCVYLGQVEDGYIALKPSSLYIYQQLLHPVSVDGNEILDFDIQGVIGHSGSTAGGDVTAVIGSALPYTEPLDKYSSVPDDSEVVTITSRGPHIKVVQ